MRFLQLILTSLLVCTAASAQSGLIIIPQAAYGSDQRLCDATAPVNTLCGGKPTCSVAASNTLCGDPDPGVVKKLTVIYRCDRTGEDRVVEAIEHQSPVTLSCAGIHIQAVAYGKGDRYCDATQAFAESCNGQTSCSVPVSNRLCGDPSHGIVKAAQITYQCGTQQQFTTVAENGVAKLSC